MTERNLGQNLPRPPSTSESIYLSGMLAGFYGGISYGLGRWIGDSEIGEKAGIGVGLGIGTLTLGVLLGTSSAERAIQLAQEGKKIRALLKSLQGSVESAIGCGASGAIAGYEAKGLTGAAIGAASAAFIGGVGMFQVTLFGMRYETRAVRSHNKQD